jgi:hypothetical protein
MSKPKRREIEGSGIQKYVVAISFMVVKMIEGYRVDINNELIK